MQPVVSMIGMPPQGSGAPPSPLLTGLVAYWTFDHVGYPAATLNDSHGANHFVVAGSGPYEVEFKQPPADLAGGIAWLAADMTWAQTAAAILPVCGTTMSFCGWVRLTDNSAPGFVIGQWQAGGGMSWMLGTDLSVGCMMSMRVSYDGNLEAMSVLEDSFNMAVGNSYWVQGYIDTDLLRMGISMNGDAWHTVVLAAAHYATPNTGCLLGAEGTYGYFDGLMDEFGLWNRKLSDAEFAELYNGGTGKTYPFA